MSRFLEKEKKKRVVPDRILIDFSLELYDNSVKSSVNRENKVTENTVCSR